jgi:hypothetical protein
MTAGDTQRPVNVSTVAAPFPHQQMQGATALWHKSTLQNAIIPTKIPWNARLPVVCMRAQHISQACCNKGR